MVCTFEIDGMNDAGVLVGETGYRGFVRYRDGREISILPLSTQPEYNGTRASAIDNEGHVVGATTIDVTNIRQIPMGSQQRAGGPVETINGPNRDDFLIHAFLATFTGGKQHMHDLGGLGGASTYATALNEDLTVVGYSGRRLGAKWSRVSQEGHAWVWQRGRMTDLGALEKANSIAYGVNDASVIVGCSGDDAVRWVNKRIENLNHLIDPRSGWHLTCARAINRAGIIVGVGTHGGASLPFRLIPIR